MSTLKYRSRAMVEDLELGECTIHRASGSAAARWWQLWFYAPRDDDGQPEYFCVPVIPGGSYCAGPGGKTWGLNRASATTWQVSPSINVLSDQDAVSGTHEEPSIWHQTPLLVDVPDDEPWTNRQAP